MAPLPARPHRPPLTASRPRACALRTGRPAGVSEVSRGGLPLPACCARGCSRRRLPVVLHLKQQDVISVVGEGVNLCPHGKLSWLQIATKSHVFLFDIFLLGPQAFRNGLQAVLEDKNILKVMHDCRWISDCLFHQYSVLLDNVFDTQVADVLQFSVATGGFFPHRTCTLQECLMQHLRIPSKWKTLMKCKQQMALENPDTWFLRPLPASLLQVLALKAMCLLLLHSSLMDNFMADLTAVVHAYLNTSQNRSEDHLGSMEVGMSLFLSSVR